MIINSHSSEQQANDHEYHLKQAEPTRFVEVIKDEFGRWLVIYYIQENHNDINSFISK